MACFSLPVEIIIEVVENLDKEQDINSLIRVSRKFYNLFDDYLYRYNVKNRGCNALFWAARHDGESTARKVLQLGADVNVKLQEAGLEIELEKLILNWDSQVSYSHICLLTYLTENA